MRRIDRRRGRNVRGINGCCGGTVSHGEVHDRWLQVLHSPLPVVDVNVVPAGGRRTFLLPPPPLLRLGDVVPAHQPLTPELCLCPPTCPLVVHIIPPACHVQLEDKGVAIGRGGRSVLVDITAILVEQPWVDVERDQAEAVQQHLVVYEARVVPHVLVLDGHGWDLGDHDPLERVCKGDVNANQLEHELVLR